MKGIRVRIFERDAGKFERTLLNRERNEPGGQQSVLGRSGKIGADELISDSGDCNDEFGMARILF